MVLLGLTKSRTILRWRSFGTFYKRYLYQVSILVDGPKGDLQDYKVIYATREGRLYKNLRNPKI